jgi:hypothetical protein
MFDFIKRPYSAFVSRLDLWRYRTNDRARRLYRAWCYFTDRFSADDAQWIMFDCRNAAGCHPLLILTVEDTLKQARETFVDHPKLPRLIADGCERVGDKWESHNDDLYHAQHWAIELAEEYAAQEGIKLVRLDESAATHDGELVSDAIDGGAP